jgi:hypothetical protein
MDEAGHLERRRVGKDCVVVRAARLWKRIAKTRKNRDEAKVCRNRRSTGLKGMVANLVGKRKLKIKWTRKKHRASSRSVDSRT